MVPDADDQLSGIERFGYVVNGAHFESSDDIVDARLAGQENDRYPICRRGSLQTFTGSETIHYRHRDIEQDQGGMHLFRQFERLKSVAAGMDFVALVLQNGP